MSKMRVIDRQAFLVDEKISPKMSVTPEGYLLCESVPIARTGSQIYSEDEVSSPESGEIVGKDGYVIAERSEDEVFSEETMASFEGKPVTIDHPDGFVDPSNWRQLAVGTVNNVRRGEGIQGDLLMADLLITDQDGIDSIQVDGIRQVSCGYDTEYEQLAPGRAAQRNIVGNHVAIVARGRAGERCSIGDNMSKKVTLMDKLKHFLKDNAAELVTEQIEEELAKDEDVAMSERISQLELAIAAIGEKLEKLLGTMDRSMKDGEEIYEEVMDEEIDVIEPSEDPAEDVVVVTADSMRAVLARAEILSPGFKPHTYDGKELSQRAVKVQALTAACRTVDGAKVVKKLLGSIPSSFSKMSNDSLNVLFRAASEAAKEKNNVISFADHSAYQSRDSKGMSIIRSMNEAAAKLRS